MSIEYRAVLTHEMVFQSGTKLAEGTIIYVEETPHGWVAKHYDKATSAGGLVFQLEVEDFSLFKGTDLAEEIVVAQEPDEQEDEEARERAALARRRMESTVVRLRRKADELETFLADSPAIPLVPGRSTE